MVKALCGRCCGVGQGPFMGSLLFLVFINNLLEELRTIVELFVNDTSLFLLLEILLQVQKN